MSTENEEPTPVKESEMSVERTGDLNLNAVYTIEYGEVNPLLHYKIFKLDESEGLAVMQPLDKSIGADSTVDMKVVPITSLRHTNEFIKTRSSFLDIFHRHNKTAPKWQPEVERPLDPAFVALSDFEASKIVSGDNGADETPAFTQEVAPKVETIYEAPTVAPVESVEMLEEYDKEEVKPVRAWKVGRDDVEVRKVAIVDAGDATREKVEVATPASGPALKFTIETEQSTPVEIEVPVESKDTQATPEQQDQAYSGADKYELYAEYLEGVYQVKDEVLKAVDFAAEKVDARLSMGTELRKTYEDIMAIAQEVQQLSSVENRDDFERKAADLKRDLQKLSETLFEFDISGTDVVGAVIDYTKDVLSKQSDDAANKDAEYNNMNVRREASSEEGVRSHEAVDVVKGLATRLVPFTRDTVGALNTTKRYNTEASRDLDDAALDLQRMIDSFNDERGVDRDSITVVVETLIKYNPDSNRNEDLFSNLKKALQSASDAIKDTFATQNK